MDQSTNIGGHGNIVVQTIGDGNTVHFAARLPSLWLTAYDSPLWADVPSVPLSLQPAPGYTATGLEEASLLSPYTRKLPLLGRDAVLADLTTWLEGSAPISVQVIVGGGGRGKTRLALELCAVARKQNFLAGFVTRDEMDRFRAQQSVAEWGWNKPVLVVIDYAAAKVREIGDWLADLTHHRCWNDASSPKLRLLLLERHGERDSIWLRTAFWRRPQRGARHATDKGAQRPYVARPPG